MALIELDSVSLDYPVYDVLHRSLKRRLVGLRRGSRQPPPVLPALRGVSMVVERDERVGLYGPNGSGKSSLLRVLAGIYPPTRGTLHVRGSVLPLLGLGVGANMDIGAEDNIRLLLRVEGVRPSQSMVDAIWDFTELSASMRPLPLRMFSSGMLMRVLFAVSTAVATDVLLLDEWLSVVDGQFSRKAEERMRQLVSRAGVVVIASHDLAMLNENCTRILCLENGRIVDDVKPPLAPAARPQAT
jgi:lipopolysaccharide transport system ATP-binding protein